MLDTECNPPGATGSSPRTAELRGRAQAEVKPPCGCVSRGAQRVNCVPKDHLSHRIQVSLTRYQLRPSRVLMSAIILTLNEKRVCPVSTNWGRRGLHLQECPRLTQRSNIMLKRSVHVPLTLSTFPSTHSLPVIFILEM